VRKRGRSVTGPGRTEHPDEEPGKEGVDASPDAPPEAAGDDDDEASRESFPASDPPSTY
jgi:hypothetical protein